MPIDLFAARRRGRIAMRGALFAILLFLAGLLVLAVRPAAQTARSAGKPLQHEVTVSLKLVQVYVAGKGGVPVADLKPEDFEVTDNGRAAAVTHFERHFLRGAEEPAAPPAGASSLSRKFLLLFDFAFTDPRGVLKSREAGLRFIDATLRPEDEVALLSYTPDRGLVIHEYLTTDHQRVRRLVEGFGLKKAAGRAENLTEFIYSRELLGERTARAENDTPGDAFFARQSRLQGSDRVDEGVRLSYVDKARDFLAALTNLAVALRRLPGFKNVILFSEGIAAQVLFGRRGSGTFATPSTLDALSQQMRELDAGLADAGVRSDFTRMLEEFKASNAPVYTLDVSRSQSETDFPLAAGPEPPGAVFAGADSLRQLASVTGGRFYASTVSAEHAAGDIQSVTGAFYVLGYYVGEAWDGKFHRIKVRVKRPGCDVVAQGGYFDAKPFKEYSGFEKLLHVTDLALSDVPRFQAPKEIPVAATAVTVKGRPGLAVFARAARAELGDVLGAKSEAYLLLLDEAGEIGLIKRFKLPLPGEPSGKDTFFPCFVLEARPGRATCRIVLRNMDTGLGARGSASLVVPDAAGTPLVLDPPLLLVPDARALDLSASTEESLSALFGYAADAYAPLVGAVPAGSDKLLAALRCSSGSPAPDIRFSAALGEPGGAAMSEVPVTVVKMSRNGPTTLALVELATGELRSGRHAFRVEAKDASGAAAASIMEFEVR
ncbi:MAG TPA: VWA domain-containing protein [Terriglobales bacterium]|nr:VWA domain-containing protein [Terriglobales bacterium]